MHVPVVQPVQVDVVGLQPAQGVLARGNDGLAPGTAAVGISRIEVAAELGGDDQPVAPPRMPSDVVADDLLGMALGVEIGGIDEITAELDVPVDDLLRFLDA